MQAHIRKPLYGEGESHRYTLATEDLGPFLAIWGWTALHQITDMTDADRLEAQRLVDLPHLDIPEDTGAWIRAREYTITRLRQGTDRYVFDTHYCKASEGWAQVDTAQDAWYYGGWANPITRRMTTYAEGDVTITDCATDEAFIAEIRRWAAWSKGAGYGFAIDGMCLPMIINAFTRLGLADLLH